jgi:hypothetical protein
MKKQNILNARWPVMVSLSNHDARRGPCPHASTGLSLTSYIEHAMGCHPEPVEGRRAQWPIRVLSMMQMPLPASWFDKPTMTAQPSHLPFRFHRISFLITTPALFFTFKPGDGKL